MWRLRTVMVVVARRRAVVWAHGAEGEHTFWALGRRVNVDGTAYGIEPRRALSRGFEPERACDTLLTLRTNLNAHMLSGASVIRSATPSTTVKIPTRPDQSGGCAARRRCTGARRKSSWLRPGRAVCSAWGCARRALYLEPARRCVAPCALPWCEKRLRALMGAAPPTAPGVTVVRQLATLPAASIPSTSVRSVELYASVSSSSINARSRRSRWIVACEEKKRRCGEQAQVCAQGWCWAGRR